MSNEHVSKAPHNTGVFATLRARLPAQGSGAPAISGVRRFGLLAAALAAGALLAASPASALTAHAFSFSFGSQGAGAGQLSSPTGVAVSTGGTHDVYVADGGNRRVDEFEANGTFIRAWGWGVATGAAEPQVCTSSCLAGLSGTAPGEFVKPAFVAVDNDPSSPSFGDVYVGDEGSNLVQKFDAGGNLITGWGDGGAGLCGTPNGQLSGACAIGGRFTGIAGVAVDTSGNLNIVDPLTRNWFKFAQGGSPVTTIKDPRVLGPDGILVDSSGNLYQATGLFVEQISPGGSDVGSVAPAEARGLGIDQANDDVYIDLGNRVNHYDGGTLSACVPAGDCQVADSFGSSQLSGGAGVAVNPASGGAYVADSTAGKVDVFGAAIDATTQAASSPAGTSLTLNGAVNPDGTAVVGCEFEIVDAADYNPSAGDPYSAGQTVPCAQTPAQIGSGTSPVAVSRDVTGLLPSTTYHFRLLASDAGASADGADQTAQTLLIPEITNASVTNLTGAAADLGADVNPEGLDATYHFQWGVSTSYGTTVPIPDGDAGSGTSPVPVTTHLTGLTANQTYHWRIIATDVNGTRTSPDHTFVYDTTGQGLPDGRAYEQVTPPEKNGSLAEGLGLWPASIAADGSRVIFSSVQCFAGAESCGIRGSVGSFVNPFSATRTPTGWSTTAMLPPARLGNGSGITYSADANTALYSISTPPHGEDDFYERQPDGSFGDIGPITPPASGALGGGSTQLAPILTTADLSHVAWQDAHKTYEWPFDSSSSEPLSYEYSGAGNSQPVLIGVSGAGPQATDLVSQCGTSLAFGPGAMSADGSTVYFTAGGASDANCGASEPPANVVGARIDGTLPDAHTVLISDRSPAACGSACQSSPPGDAHFWGASSDGSKALFLSTQQLVDSASEDSAAGDSANNCISTHGPNGCNLYLYDFDAPSGSRLVDVSATTEPGGPRVQGVVGLSADGSHMYFVAKGVLTTAANAQGQAATGGAENLYVYERDASSPGGRTAFIAALSSANINFAGSDSSQWLNYVDNVTPDGRYLVFTSHESLTADAANASGAVQVYRYDAQTGQLNRVSSGNDGFNDNGNAGAGEATIVPARDTEALSVPARLDPTMSDDGSRVFFQSPIGLTPRALDDVVTDAAGDLAQNLYEWEQAGAGSCPASRAAGCVYLISDGRDESAGSSFCANDNRFPGSAVCLLGTDTTGANVFFQTADRLVPQDTDSGVDIYDARICEPEHGDPCIAAPATPPPCLGEQCHGVPPAIPGAPNTPTSTFNGAGNLVPPVPVEPRSRSTAEVRAEKLGSALRACRRIGARKRRSACEAAARKRYGANRKAKKSDRRTSR